MALTGSRQPVKYAPRDQARLVRNRVGSTAQAKADLGFEARIGLDEGLRELIDWRRQHVSQSAPAASR